MFVYVIQSLQDGRLYKGISRNPYERLKQHNSGKTKSTKGFRPWKLIYKEQYETTQEARNREKYLKSGAGRAYLHNIINKNGLIA